MCYVTYVVIFRQRYQPSRHEPAAPGRHAGGGAAGRRRHHRRAAQPDHRRGTQVHQQGQRSGHQVGHNHVQCNLIARFVSFQRVLPLRPLLPARGCRRAAHRPALHLQRLLPRPRVSHAGGGAVRPVLPLHREYE